MCLWHKIKSLCKVTYWWLACGVNFGCLLLLHSEKSLMVNIKCSWGWWESREFCRHLAINQSIEQTEALTWWWPQTWASVQSFMVIQFDCILRKQKLGHSWHQCREDASIFIQNFMAKHGTVLQFDNAATILLAWPECDTSFMTIVL